MITKLCNDQIEAEFGVLDLLDEQCKVGQGHRIDTFRFL